MAATSTSVKSLVPCPAHADRARSADFAFMSTLPVGWSCRSRRPAEVPRNVLVTVCSAKPYSLRPVDCAAANAPPSSSANRPNTPIWVPVTGSSHPGPSAPLMLNAAAWSGPGSGAASSAGEPSLAACSAARTTSSTWSSRTPARDTTPAEVPAAPRLIAITVSCRDRATPFVVSVLPGPAQVGRGRLVRQHDGLVAAGRGECPLDRLLRLRRHGQAPSSVVFSTRTPRISTAGQPWLTGATCPGWPLPQLNAPPSR